MSLYLHLRGVRRRQRREGREGGGQEKEGKWCSVYHSDQTPTRRVSWQTERRLQMYLPVFDERRCFVHEIHTVIFCHDIIFDVYTLFSAILVTHLSYLASVVHRYYDVIVAMDHRCNRRRARRHPCLPIWSNMRKEWRGDSRSASVVNET